MYYLEVGKEYTKLYKGNKYFLYDGHFWACYGYVTKRGWFTPSTMEPVMLHNEKTGECIVIEKYKDIIYTKKGREYEQFQDFKIYESSIPLT